MDETASTKSNSIGGWIRGADDGFDNDRDFRSLPELADVPLDPQKVRYFQAYQNEYFNQAFLPDQGTEEILDALAAVPTAGDWLDLGAGTSTLFWALPVSGLRSITCADVIPEPLAVLDSSVREGVLPRCYSDVLEMRGIPPEHVNAKRHLFHRYLLLDALKPWPAAMAGERFDLITAIGIFGLAAGPNAYAACFPQVAAHLRIGGYAVGADWIRSPDFVAQEGHDNSYICEDLTRQAIAHAGLEIVSCQKVRIKGDRLYDDVVVWAAKPPIPKSA